MVRMQIQFTEGQARELKKLAAESDSSVAALTRDAVQEMLIERNGASPEERAKRLIASLGKFSSGEPGSNVAVEHDRYLDEIYADRG